MLFYQLLTFFNGPDHNLEFVQYLEFAFYYIPIDVTTVREPPVPGSEPAVPVQKKPEPEPARLASGGSGS